MANEVKLSPGAGEGCSLPPEPDHPQARILLYSHDSYGLGHLRRSLAIANALTARDDHCNVLLVTGSPCATQFDIPSRCDVLKVPSVGKDQLGQYIPLSRSGSLSKTLELRRRLILEAYRSFDPHLVLVDHQLTGLHGEVMDVLKEARDGGKKLVYGMRDVLDASSAVARTWKTLDHHWALTQAYDRICIYGVPEVFDPREQYPVLEPVRGKIEFTGYIVTPQSRTSRSAIPSFKRKILVTVGGGEDGFQHIETYLRALLLEPADWNSHIVTGPLMNQANVRHLKQQVYREGLADRVKVSRFYPNLPNLLQQSDAVVSMAGYNSCAEILQSGIPAVLMPRLRPRQEQLIRARRFEELGIAQCVTGDVPSLLRAAIDRMLESRIAGVYQPSLAGLDRLCDIVIGLVDSGVRSGASATPKLPDLCGGEITC